jgi:hypothetical protein
MFENTHRNKSKILVEKIPSSMNRMIRVSPLKYCSLQARVTIGSQGLSDEYFQKIDRILHPTDLWDPGKNFTLYRVYPYLDDGSKGDLSE